jgi:hypothetical protein
MKAGLGKPDAKLKTATFNETAHEGFLDRVAIFQIRFSRTRSNRHSGFPNQLIADS